MSSARNQEVWSIQGTERDAEELKKEIADHASVVSIALKAPQKGTSIKRSAKNQSPVVEILIQVAVGLATSAAYDSVKAVVAKYCRDRGLVLKEKERENGDIKEQDNSPPT